MTIHDVLGRRYASGDILVVGLAAEAESGRDEDRELLLNVRGVPYLISFGEFRTLIERQLLVERRSSP